MENKRKEAVQVAKFFGPWDGDVEKLRLVIAELPLKGNGWHQLALALQKRYPSEWMELIAMAMDLCNREDKRRLRDGTG